MAQFIPHWSLEADADIISEGGVVLAKLSISRDSTEPDTYELQDEQYLELTYKVTGAGETFEDRDYTLNVGEDINNLKPITDSSKITITKIVQLDKKSFTITDPTQSQSVYFFKLYCDVDGVWDGPESVEIKILSINEVTLTDGQISNIESSGDLISDTVLIKYNDSTEIWVTPGLVTRDDEMFSIGEIHYGSDSRLFVQAYGQSRPYDVQIDYDPSYPASLDDQANRVYVPTYRIIDMTPSEMPANNRTGKGTIFNISPDEIFPDEGEEMTMVIQDDLGAWINTGLKFNGNGQILSTMLYESTPIDGYFRAKIIDIRDYYNTPKDAFYIGKRFKAYQMWVCPDDTTYISGNPKPRHLYQLKNTDVYPYVIKEVLVDGDPFTSFVENDWYDLGFYDVRLGNNIIGQERTFRLIVNNDTGSDIDFITDSDLGVIHVGEYFGHTVYPKIQATGTMPTFELAASSRDDITKYNLDLAADGTLVGTAYARPQDFTANDEIYLEFDVTGTDINGSSKTATFKLRILRGFGPNFLSAYLKPNMLLERKWFSTISTANFFNQAYYRTVDDRYGLQKYPYMLLKENFVNPTYSVTSLQELKSTIRDSLINPSSGSPVPDGIFSFVMGNYKVRSALDTKGNILYDVLYREIHPKGSIVEVSMDPLKYTEIEPGSLSEFFGLRQNLYQVVGEDIQNLLSDPDDYQARAITVPAVPGISVEMTDTVPRFMNHPYIDDGVTAELLPCITVAYFMPGQGESFFTKLLFSNEHGALVGETFDITSVSFQYFFPQYEKYVRDYFSIQVKEQSRL